MLKGPPGLDQWGEPGPSGSCWRFWALVFRKSARQLCRIAAIPLCWLGGSYLFVLSVIVSVVGSRGRTQKTRSVFIYPGAELEEAGKHG